MLLAPLLEAEPTIQIHVGSAIAAFLIGGFVLWRKKGTALHKALGRIWVMLMLVVATSALFINEIRLIGPFSPIHMFALLTYAGVGFGLWAVVVRKDVKRHRTTMQATYLGALMLAGTFTFLPGRRMHAVLFGTDAGWLPSLLLIGAVLAVTPLSGGVCGPNSAVRASCFSQNRYPLLRNLLYGCQNPVSARRHSAAASRVEQCPPSGICVMVQLGRGPMRLRAGRRARLTAMSRPPTRMWTGPSQPSALSSRW